MTVISLFEKWQTTHEHFENETDALHELWIILLSARYNYRKEVLNGGKKHHRFVEDFACRVTSTSTAIRQAVEMHTRKTTISPTAF